MNKLVIISLFSIVFFSFIASATPQTLSPEEVQQAERLISDSSNLQAIIAEIAQDRLPAILNYIEVQYGPQIAAQIKAEIPHPFPWMPASERGRGSLQYH